MTRKCGDCSLCCVVLGVPEISKEAGCDCPNRKPGWKACKVYDERPESCATFSCMWLDGHLSNADKPSNIGVVLQGDEHPEFGAIIVAHERSRGAAMQGRAGTLIQKLSRGVVVFVVPPDGGNRRLVCNNPKLTAKVRAFLQRKGHL